MLTQLSEYETATHQALPTQYRVSYHHPLENTSILYAVYKDRDLAVPIEQPLDYAEAKTLGREEYLKFAKEQRRLKKEKAMM